MSGFVFFWYCSTFVSRGFMPSLVLRAFCDKLDFYEFEEQVAEL